MLKPTKTYLLILSCFVVLLALSGCAGQKAADNNATGNQNAEGQKADVRNAGRGPGGMPNGNFAAASSTDLTIGQKIMVVGATNADGSTAATQIIIGNADTDFSTSTFFRMLDGGHATGTNGNPAAQQTRQNQEGQPGQGWQGQDGERPDPSRFQNMTDEERRQLRERMMAGGNNPVNGARRPVRGGGGASRLAGEIIDLDATTITLKLGDGGSKLVFYSPSTAVNKLKDNPESPAPPDSPETPDEVPVN